MAKKILKNVRINPITGEPDYFFPLEITDDSVLEYARQNFLEVGNARLGFRNFRAVFVPCKEQLTDSRGRVTFLDTPSDVQHRKYLALIKDEMDAQEKIKQDGRCQIPDGRGGVKRCPCRIANPEHVLGSDQPKTIPVKCESCPYRRFKQAHTVIELSCLDYEGEDGESGPYEIPTPESYYEADRYEELADEFVAFINARKPRLAPLAEKLVKEHSLTEVSQELGRPTSTVHSQIKKLQELLNEFLDLTSTI